jgi:hypothetical protein
VLLHHPSPADRRLVRGTVHVLPSLWLYIFTLHIPSVLCTVVYVHTYVCIHTYQGSVGFGPTATRRLAERTDPPYENPTAGAEERVTRLPRPGGDATPAPGGRDLPEPSIEETRACLAWFGCCLSFDVLSDSLLQDWNQAKSTSDVGTPPKDVAVHPP